MGILLGHVTGGRSGARWSGATKRRDRDIEGGDRTTRPRPPTPEARRLGRGRRAVARFAEQWAPVPGTPTTERQDLTPWARSRSPLPRFGVSDGGIDCSSPKEPTRERRKRGRERREQPSWHQERARERRDRGREREEPVADAHSRTPLLRSRGSEGSHRVHLAQERTRERSERPPWRQERPPERRDRGRERKDPVAEAHSRTPLLRSRGSEGSHRMRLAQERTRERRERVREPRSSGGERNESSTERKSSAPIRSSRGSERRASATE
jgi:hypothetical protein